MELQLKIYDGKKVEKVYTTDTINCSFGTVEDILDALDFEHIKKGDSFELATIVVKCSKQLKPFLKDLFDGLTDEEIRKTKMSDLINIFKALYQYAVTELGVATTVTDPKN